MSGTLRLTPVNFKRYREWQAVLRGEGWRLHWGEVAWLLLRFWRWRPRRECLRLLRLCATCPVYRQRFHQCRPYPGSPLGCGCHMPTKVKFGGGCWAHEFPELELGWKSRTGTPVPR